jgi:hypothetical protein
MTDAQPLQPITSAPKDKTIIAAGGWYEHPATGVRTEMPSYVAWDDLAGGWIMQDDHRRTYNEPKQWVSA